MKRFTIFVNAVFFWVFLAVKIGGVSLVAWSWWWVLFPPVPVIAIFVQKAGL